MRKYSQLATPVQRCRRLSILLSLSCILAFIVMFRYLNGRARVDAVLVADLAQSQPSFLGAVRLFSKLNARDRWYNTLQHEQIANIGERLNGRKEWIQNLCQDRKDIIENIQKRLFKQSRYRNYRQHKRYLIDKQSGVGLCLLPKSGSTYWKFFYNHIATGKNGVIFQQKVQRKSRRIKKYLNPATFKTMYPKPSTQLKLYVFARDPWDRMVSLYRQKIQYGSKATKRYVQGACRRAITTFLQLATCIADTWEKGYPNQHWEPAFTYCDICSTPYQFYGRLDKAVDEASYMFQMWKFSENPNQLLQQARDASIRNVEKKSAHSDYSQYFRGLPEALIRRLQDMYRIDVLMFGLKRHPLHD